MNYSVIKEQLANEEYLTGNAFKILQSISLFVNKRTSESKGRDLVIRALDKKRFFSKYPEILQSLVRSVGLFPYMTDSISLSGFDDYLAYEFHRPVNMGEDIVFHSLQGEIYQEILNGKNIVLSANTSVGKSLVIDAIIASGKFKTIVIILPTIALIDETRQRLSKRFREQCKIITHPSQSRSDDNALINIYVLTQERLLNRTDLDSIDFFIMDEFYKLDPKSDSDDERAIALNLALYKLLKVSKQFYLIGPNIDDLSGLNNLSISYLFIPSKFSTVAVDVKRYNLKTKDPEREKTLLSLVKKLDGPIMVYCQSPRSVNEVAEAIIESSNEVADVSLEDAFSWVSDEFDESWVFLKALKSGIGLHHGGIPRALQQLSIRLFNERKLRVLVCSSTIIEGVNTVAKNVIIYDRRKSTNLLDFFTYKNIEGRAGRMGQHFIGKIFSLEAPPAEQISKVSIPIGEQGEDAPISLLLQLDEDDVTAESQKRINNALNNSLLSIDTIKKNLPYSPESQNRLASVILNDLVNYNDVLFWTTFPKEKQLKAVCNLIFNYLEENSLRKNNIFSGDSLAYHVNSLWMAKGLSNYFKNRIEEERSNHGPNETIEISLKILRNVICFTFPRALRALELIQEEILSKNQLPNIGRYGIYASEVENLFMDPALFALDEYGIPLQTAEKLKDYLKPNGNLDEVLFKIKNFPSKFIGISKFEQGILSNVKQYI